MWERFKRAMRSLGGFFVSSIESPELILEQNIRDMNDQVPKMNESIAMVRANLTLLEKENAKYKAELNSLTAKVKAAIQAGRDDLAGQFAVTLQTERSTLDRNAAQLSNDLEASQEAMTAIRDHRRAQWQSKVADAMESFQVAGVDATHGEMVRKVQEQTAINEARLQLALESSDQATMQIEEDAEQLQAMELVNQM